MLAEAGRNLASQPGSVVIATLPGNLGSVVFWAGTGRARDTLAGWVALDSEAALVLMDSLAADGPLGLHWA